MTEPQYTCLKCGGNMRRGFIADKSEHYSMIARWVEGEPVRAELFGIKGDNVDISNRNVFHIRSMRCDQCGYLELYAV